MSLKYLVCHHRNSIYLFSDLTDRGDLTVSHRPRHANKNVAENQLPLRRIVRRWQSFSVVGAELFIDGYKACHCRPGLPSQQQKCCFCAAADVAKETILYAAGK